MSKTTTRKPRRPTELKEPKAKEPIKRYQIGYTDEQRDKWKIAAATSGLPLHIWIQRTLDAEAVKATHVPQVRRG